MLSWEHCWRAQWPSASLLTSAYLYEADVLFQPFPTFVLGMALLPSGLLGPSRGTIAARPTLPIDQ